VRRFSLTACAALLFVMFSASPSYALYSTQCSIALNKRAVTFDSPAVLTGQLKTGSGGPIAGATVHLLRGGAIVRALKTDSKGRISAYVNYGGPAVWRLRSVPTGRYVASVSPQLSTYPILMLNKVFTGVQLNDTYTTTQDLRLSKGHTYQVLFDHPARVFFGRREIDLMQDLTAKMRSFAYKVPLTDVYWCEWDWGGSISRGDRTLRVIIW
jgi:hypothetical protein